MNSAYAFVMGRLDKEASTKTIMRTAGRVAPGDAHHNVPSGPVGKCMSDWQGWRRQHQATPITRCFSDIQACPSPWAYWHASCSDRPAERSQWEGADEV